MWDDIYKIFSKALLDSCERFTTIFKGWSCKYLRLDFELPEEEYESSLARHKLSVWNTFLETLRSGMLDVQVVDRLRIR